MIKIVIDGSSGPYVSTGLWVGEDETYITLNNNGVKIKIPIRRVIRIEDMRDIWEDSNQTPKTSPPYMLVQQELPSEEPASIVPPTSNGGYGDPLLVDAAKQIKPPVTTTREELMEKIGNKLNLTTPSIEESKRENVEVNVTVTGAVTKSISLEMPLDTIEKGLSPTMMKFISMSPEVKGIMEGGIILDGVPEVSGRNIYLKTKALKETVKNLGQTVGLASKMGGVVSAFQKPTGNSPTDFSTIDNSDFSIPKSPFEGPVLLNHGAENESS